MKKNILSILVAVLCLSLLTGCMCKHEVWNPADCVTPKTCAECGETDGTALGHVWMAATCDLPKTCETCGITEGEPKGHSWTEATCEAPKTCSACHLTEGDALGHNWVDATTEAPKTCVNCAAIEGERIITDPRFTTAATAELQGKWVCNIPMTGEMLGYPDMEDVLYMQYFVELQNNGDMSMYVLREDEEAFIDFVIRVTVESAYAELAAEGFSKEEADAAFMDGYGMTVEEYLREVLKGFSINKLLESILGSIDISGVYYVENGILYTGMTWDSTMDTDEYILDGDKLFIPSMYELIGEDTPLTRVVE